MDFRGTLMKFLSHGACWGFSRRIFRAALAIAAGISSLISASLFRALDARRSSLRGIRVRDVARFAISSQFTGHTASFMNWFLR